MDSYDENSLNAAMASLHSMFLGLALAAVSIASPVAAQSGASLVDNALQTTVRALEAALVRDAEAAVIETAVAAAQDYLDALGRSQEREATQLVVDLLGKRESGAFLLTDSDATRLFDEVRYQRTRGRPQRMLPALLVLQQQYPDDARVLYAMGEAYGIASPVADQEKALAAFERLLEVLRGSASVATTPVGRARLLSEYLPELAAAGLLSPEQQSDGSVWLRRHVLGFCDQLRSGKPIGLWRLADPRLDALYEELVIARRDLDQKRCRELIDAMLAIQPVNPVLCHAAAEVHCSLGPEFNPKKAVSHLDAFLQMTDPGVLGGPDDRRSPIMGKSDVLRDIRRFRLARPRDGLEATRIAARDLKRAMKQRKPERMLLAPNAKELKREFKRLGKQLQRDRRSRNGLKQSLAKNERNLSRVVGTYKEPQFRQKIAIQKKKLKQWDLRIGELEAKVDRMRSLLDSQ